MSDLKKIDSYFDDNQSFDIRTSAQLQSGVSWRRIFKLGLPCVAAALLGMMVIMPNIRKSTDLRDNITIPRKNEMEKLHIESALMKLDITQPTKENILKLIQRFGTVEIFGRSEICKATGLQERAASYLIGTMLRHRLLDTVKGHGKGKYRFRATVWTGEHE